MTRRKCSSRLAELPICSVVHMRGLCRAVLVVGEKGGCAKLNADLRLRMLDEEALSSLW